MKSIVISVFLCLAGGFLYWSQKVGASDTKGVRLHDLDALVTVRVTRSNFDMMVKSSRATREITVEKHPELRVNQVKQILKSKGVEGKAAARELLKQQRETVFSHRSGILTDDIKDYTLSTTPGSVEINFKRLGKLYLVARSDGTFELKF
jgi:hypothetical protein